MCFNLITLICDSVYLKLIVKNFNDGVLRSVVNGFGTQCSKNICNKCIKVSRQADRQDIISKRYNPYDSGKFHN